jgi:hypothetical protein
MSATIATTPTKTTSQAGEELNLNSVLNKLDGAIKDGKLAITITKKQSDTSEGTITADNQTMYLFTFKPGNTSRCQFW